MPYKKTSQQVSASDLVGEASADPQEEQATTTASNAVHANVADTVPLQQKAPQTEESGGASSYEPRRYHRESDDRDRGGYRGGYRDRDNGNRSYHQQSVET
ncbi:MAG TPA: hypothetical protein VLF20_00905, partial [Patescibacteria group bacterium]|nr:hypothetical protein [Patescibacteria group bacterium]